MSEVQAVDRLTAHFSFRRAQRRNDRLQVEAPFLRHRDKGIEHIPPVELHVVLAVGHDVEALVGESDLANAGILVEVAELHPVREEFGQLLPCARKPLFLHPFPQGNGFSLVVLAAVVGVEFLDARLHDFIPVRFAGFRVAVLEGKALHPCGQVRRASLFDIVGLACQLDNVGHAGLFHKPEVLRHQQRAAAAVDVLAVLVELATARVDMLDLVVLGGEFILHLCARGHIVELHFVLVLVGIDEAVEQIAAAYRVQVGLDMHSEEDPHFSSRRDLRFGSNV